MNARGVSDELFVIVKTHRQLYLCSSVCICGSFSSHVNGSRINREDWIPASAGMTELAARAIAGQALR